MARQIIILETRKNLSEGTLQVNGFNWFAIANAAARVPYANFVSAGAGLSGAAQITTAEQAALNDGSVREEQFTVELAISATTTQVKGELIRRYTDRANAIAAEPPTRQFYGVSFDGTAWSA